MPPRAFVDSNVLASRTLRDWIFLLRNEVPGMYELWGSLDIVAEAIRVVRRQHPDAGGDITAGLTELLHANLNEVLTRYPAARDFAGSDPDDQHVHAAAVACGASYLITDNPSDFGDPDELPYELYTADDFFCLVDDGAGSHVLEVTRKQAAYWQSRRAEGHTTKPLDVALADAGCSQFAARVTNHLRVLAGPTAVPAGPPRAQRRQQQRRR